MSTNYTGHYAKTPRSEWHTKKSGKRKTYFQKMQDEIKQEQRDAELAEAKATLAEAKEAYELAKSKSKKTPPPPGTFRKRGKPYNNIDLDDFCHFLADRLKDADDMPIPFRVVKSFAKIIFDTIGDLMVEHGILHIANFGSLYAYWAMKGTYKPKFEPDEALLKRINETYEHLTLKTTPLLEVINQERTEREKKNDKQADKQLAYMERKRQWENE